MEAEFVYYDIDEGAINEMHTVAIGHENHVELALDSLVPNTEYGFMLRIRFADGRIRLTSPHYFVTENNVAVSSYHNPQLWIYPNPATDVVHIQGTDADEIQVFNALGQLVKTVHGSNEVNVGDLSVGNYILRVTSANPLTEYVLPLSKHSH